MGGILHMLKALVGLAKSSYQNDDEPALEREVERIRETHHEATRKNVEAVQCMRNSARILDEVVDVVRGKRNDLEPNH
jgi:hypothetical protein